MTYRGNGRTIKIPVRQIPPSLPVTEKDVHPLLGGPADVSGVEPEVEETVPVIEAKVEDEILSRQAEVEEIRRRAERRAEAQIQQTRRRLLTRLLTVADNLELALAHAAENDPLYEGVRLTLEDLRGQLAQEGIEPIQALGQLFNPNLHEAVASDGSGGDVVVKVLRTGYKLDGELLRPARVIVGDSDGRA